MAARTPKGDRRPDLPVWLAAVADKKSYAWALKAWDKAAKVKGAWFDHALADEIVELWPKWFKLTQDRFAGLPFKLALWQELVVRLMVGWRKPDPQLDPVTHEPVVYHVRVFRRLYLWIPRKNGKSEFLAALGLLFFIVDGVTDGEGYCFARDETQGAIVLRKMKAMIALNDEWARDVVTYKKSFWVKQFRAAFTMLTGAEDGKHGASPTVVVGDEMHEWRSRVIADTLEEGTGARLEPVFLYGSTAGPKGNKAGDELWDETLAILDGRQDDVETLAVVFAAEPDDDPYDEAVWAKANPSLGLSPTLSYLRSRAAKAKQSSTAFARFCCYHLNIWVDAAVRWFDTAKWDRCSSGKDAWKTFPELMRGRRCWGGFDLSSTTDITALVWFFEPTEDDPRWRLICRFWVPADTLTKRVREDRAPYEAFREAAALETTPGDYVDQDIVKKALLEGWDAYDVQGIGYDPWNARKLFTDLQKECPDLAEVMHEVRQGIPSLGEASKHFERLVLSASLDHGGNPVLRWMAQNVIVRFDENMNFAPAKKKSREKIDGIAASVNACAVAFKGEEAEPEAEVIVL